MSTIQPPGGPPPGRQGTQGSQTPHGPDNPTVGPRDVDPTDGPAATAATETPPRATFQSTLASQSVSPQGSVSGTRGDPTQAVLADLRAARITPDEAVQRLTAAAVAKTRCPPTLQPQVEARMKALLSRDPVVGDMLRRMGAAVPDGDD